MVSGVIDDCDGAFFMLTWWMVSVFEIILVVDLQNGEEWSLGFLDGKRFTGGAMVVGLREEGNTSLR